jgi:TolB-like protein/class 3 adenylate cyclase/Flp pilus assembly protein TadD
MGERVERRLAAVLAADVAGYSRLMGLEEEGTLARLKAARRAIVDPALASHRGRIVKTTGDGMLVEFASAVDAVRSSLEVQRSMAEQNAAVLPDQRIEFRIGIHVGDIIFDDNDIFGDGVNIAARLEGIAEPGGVCMSDDAYRQVRGKVEIACYDMGPQYLKNIAEPMRAWRVQLGSQIASKAQPGSLISQAPALALPDKPSIAVLPFQNMSGDVEQEYFADGMVEDIITGLSRSQSLFVIARNSSFTYKGKAVDIKQVGRELGVRYVLEGSTRKSGNRVRITGQLIDAATGAHLWADRFDNDLEDIFDLQDRLTSNVIGAISPQLERAEIERAQRKPTENLRAYDYYLRALFGTYQWTRQGNLEALSLARIAISLDPLFALAYALAANTFVQKKAFGWIVDASQEQVETRQLAEKAVQLGKDDPLVLAMAGQAYSFVLGEPENGVAFLTRAVALDPNLAAARQWKGWAHIYLGNVDAAIEQFLAAIRLSPLDPRLFLFQTGMGYAHFFSGRYEEGLSWARSATQRQQNFPGAQRTLMINLAMTGRIAEARQVCYALLKIDPTCSIAGIANRIPFRRPEDVEKLGQAYRIAGVPE